MADHNYTNLSCSVKDDEDVNFTVDFISDGNKGVTKIKVPHKEKKLKITNADSIFLGKGNQLREGITSSYSEITNLIPEEDHIEIDFKINDKLIQKYNKKKSEDPIPGIYLEISFLKT